MMKRQKLTSETTAPTKISLICLPDEKLALILSSVADDRESFMRLASTCKRMLSIAKKVVVNLPSVYRHTYGICINSEKMPPRSEDDEPCPIHADENERNCHYHLLHQIVHSKWLIASSISFIGIDLQHANCFTARKIMDAEGSILDRVTGLELYDVNITHDTFVLLVSKLKSLKYLDLIAVDIALTYSSCRKEPSCTNPEVRTLERITFDNEDRLLVDPRLFLPAKIVKIGIGYGIDDLPTDYLGMHRDYIKYLSAEVETTFFDPDFWIRFMKKNGLDKIKYKIKKFIEPIGPHEIQNYQGYNPADDDD